MALQDILYLQAQEKAQENATGYGQAAILGAGIGGTAGLAVGDLAQRLRPMTQQRVMPSNRVASALTPGRRFAGGLVGMVLGGALGAGTKALMAQNNPAADMLAKLQTNGELNAAEVTQLNQILADSYNSTLSMG